MLGRRSPELVAKQALPTMYGPTRLTLIGTTVNYHYLVWRASFVPLRKEYYNCTKNSMVANIIIVSSAPASAIAIAPYLDKRYSLVKAMPAQSRIRVDKWVLNSLYNQGRTNDIDNLDKLP